ncbi:hypothetical protein BROUX41_003924 [Berkeleyomyces rouxiae]|uniref:uncharacterized protein n=1 Tax=Berkeleyomyces rouxiae TaxID=2035830 RepID=UPI003B7A846E
MNPTDTTETTNTAHTPHESGISAPVHLPSASDGPRQSIDLGEIPIEIVALSDSFIESLTAKIHPTPPNIERLHALFQEFYELAASHITTHVATLASQQTREAFATALPPPLRSFLGRHSTRSHGLENSEHKVLSDEELATRQQVRKAFETKKMRLEEAVERRVCEGIYDRIYRHRSTQDQASDDRLRSRAAALALVGINPSDLGIALGDIPDDTSDAKASREKDIKDCLQDARQYLIRMNESHYPLGKLNHLRSAHRAIVETLARFQPSSSSADEILPMLIYTLITMRPEDLNVTSDVHFIQNFRWKPKLTGEAAYCLTNLEAAIGFLETVDLSTLRADEHPSGPLKISKSGSITKSATFPPAYTPGISTGIESVSQSEAAMTSTSKSRSSSRSISPSSTTTTMSGTLLAGLSRPSKPRTLSELANAPATNAIGVASDILTTADQGLKNISTSLGDSYKFVLGKLRDTNATGKILVVPTTLEEARKLISTPPPEEDVTADQAGLPFDRNTMSSDTQRDTLHRPPPLESKTIDLIGGRKQGHHGTDSNNNSRSSTFSKSVSHKDNTQSSNTAVLDSVLNLGSSLNPMARLSSSIGSFRGFGRSTSGNQVTPTSVPTSAAPVFHPTKNAKDAPSNLVEHPGVAFTKGDKLSPAFPESVQADPAKDFPKIAPPKKHFMELQNPGDIRVSEVLELLRDYRRLAKALEERDAFLS